jgi:ethanolamine utilization microcompartment shell protein EutL
VSTRGSHGAAHSDITGEILMLLGGEQRAS